MLVALNHQQCDIKNSWQPLIMNSEQKQVEQQSVGNVKYLNDAQSDLINFQLLKKKTIFLLISEMPTNVDAALSYVVNTSRQINDCQQWNKIHFDFQAHNVQFFLFASDWCSAITLTYDIFDVWMFVILWVLCAVWSVEYWVDG